MKTKDPQKVAAIYRATLALVYSEGLSGVKMAAVAKASGVATGTLYVYFESKTALLNSLYQRLKSERDVYLSPELSTGPVKQQLKRLWDDSLTYYYSHQRETFFMEQFLNSAYCNDASKSLSEQMLQGLYDLLERGKAELIIKDMDNPLLLCLLSGFLKAVASRWREQEQTLTPQMLAQSFQLCWDAIKA